MIHRLRDNLQHARELGGQRLLFRVGWELSLRTDAAGLLPLRPMQVGAAPPGWPDQLGFSDPFRVSECLRARIPETTLAGLRDDALAAATGSVVAFGSTRRDFGQPINWHRQPDNGLMWPAQAPWWRSMDDGDRIGDVKLVWEVGRFPHAYHMARAAAFFPDLADVLAPALAAQITGFIDANPLGRGVHWASGQETAVRLLAWLFAYDTMLSRHPVGATLTLPLRQALADGVAHVERYISYARYAVYNNHLIAEALALLAGSVFLPELPCARRWREVGWQILDDAASEQFYPDGGYIQQSCNYERVAIQYYLWASALGRATGLGPPPAWQKAAERALDFLYALQNPVDGTMPRYGCIDSALPCPWQTSPLQDFRPTLQALSIATRGERLFPPGPCDEPAAWLFGPLSLDSPMRPKARVSVSFPFSGHHVLRGHDPQNYAVWRCGPVRDRFNQIDMLHLDVTWRGVNVLVDGGSYLYNGPAEWHDHFLGTASHNTLMLDGQNQMVRLHRFTNVFLTQAKRLAWDDSPDWLACTGEHYGFRRLPGGAVHRRSILYYRDDLWIVLDTVVGAGTHRARLHWLTASVPYTYDAAQGRLTLAPAPGAFAIAVYDAAATPLAGSVVSGASTPPRGWVSPNYSEKIPAPSLAVEQDGALPMQFISVLGPTHAALCKEGDVYIVQANQPYRFRIVDGTLVPVAPPPA